MDSSDDDDVVMPTAKTFVLPATDVTVNFAGMTAPLDSFISDRSEEFIREKLEDLRVDPGMIDKYTRFISSKEAVKEIAQILPDHQPILDPRYHTIMIRQMPDGSKDVMSYIRAFGSSSDGSEYKGKGYDDMCSLLEEHISFVKKAKNSEAVKLVCDSDVFVLVNHLDEFNEVSKRGFETVRVPAGFYVNIITYVPADMSPELLNEGMLAELGDLTQTKYASNLKNLKEGDVVDIHILRLAYCATTGKVLDKVEGVVKSVGSVDGDVTEVVVGLKEAIHTGLSFDPIETVAVTEAVNNFVVVKKGLTQDAPIGLRGTIGVGYAKTSSCELMSQVYKVTDNLRPLHSRDPCTALHDQLHLLKRMVIKRGLGIQTPCMRQDMALFFDRYIKSHGIKEDHSVDCSQPLPEAEDCIDKDLVAPFDIGWRGPSPKTYSLPIDERVDDHLEDSEALRIISEVGGSIVTSNEVVNLAIGDSNTFAALSQSTHFKGAMDRGLVAVFGDRLDGETRKRCYMYAHAHFLSNQFFKNQVVGGSGRDKNHGQWVKIMAKYNRLSTIAKTLPCEEGANFANAFIDPKTMTQDTREKILKRLARYVSAYINTIPIFCHAALRRCLELATFDEATVSKLDVLLTSPGDDAVTLRMTSLARDIYQQLKSRENGNAYALGVVSGLRRKMKSIEAAAHIEDDGDVVKPPLVIDPKEKSAVLCELRDSLEHDMLPVRGIELKVHGRDLSAEHWSNRPHPIDVRDHTPAYDETTLVGMRGVVSNAKMELEVVGGDDLTNKTRGSLEMGLLAKVKHVLSRIVLKYNPLTEHYKTINADIKGFEDDGDEVAVVDLTRKLRTSLNTIIGRVASSISADNVSEKNLVDGFKNMLDGGGSFNLSLLSTTLPIQVENGMMKYGMRSINNVDFNLTNLVGAYSSRKSYAISPTLEKELHVHEEVDYEYTSLMRQLMAVKISSHEIRASYVKKVNADIPTKKAFKRLSTDNLTVKRQKLELLLAQIYGCCLAQYFVTM